MKRLSLVVMILVLSLSACSENSRARAFGGTMTVPIEPGHKLVNASWKNDDLWYLYRPMRDGEVPETTTFQENSTLGLVEGKVIFTESVSNR